MLDERRRRWPNIKTALGERFRICSIITTPRSPGVEPEGEAPSGGADWKLSVFNEGLI